MNQDLGLKVLGRIMNWTDERANAEFSWLRLMARLKYDGYRDFQAGMRFIESLATWLQQFTQSERETAYEFVRHSLVYIGPNEMQRLVEQFYSSTVQDRLVQTLANDLRIPPYQTLLHDVSKGKRLRRETLFMGLSDGARIDMLRHANSHLAGNEQFVPSTQVDVEKWKDLLGNLRQDLDDPLARFRLIFLIDDFAATGTSFLRYDAKKKKWKGKLVRFIQSVKDANSALIGDKVTHKKWELCIHHYVGSSAAVEAIQGRLNEMDNELLPAAPHTSFGTVLPANLPIDKTEGRHDDFIHLTKKYYDPILRTKHTDVGGVHHLGLGYGGCALPLVLEHNTPNNAVALLWAETDGSVQDGIASPAMRPLFRRRHRHA